MIFLTPKKRGFTLIELIVFIVVFSILITAVFIANTQSLQDIYGRNAILATLGWAESCMEAMLAQRKLLGYNSTMSIVSPLSLVWRSGTDVACDSTQQGGAVVSTSIAGIDNTAYSSVTPYKTIIVKYTSFDGQIVYLQSLVAGY